MQALRFAYQRATNVGAAPMPRRAVILLKVSHWM
jgi:hypothetical protein